MLSNVVAVALTVLYPLAIWLGHGRFEPRWLALLLLLAAAARLPALKISAPARWSVAGALVLVGCAVWSNLLLPLKLYPVLVNLALLGAFGASLATPVSAIERMARLSGEAQSSSGFPPVASAYMRTVTQVWCGFFVFNGAVALGTAMWASDAAWSLYTGLVSYILMGVLFGGEFLVRMRFKRLHHV
ncbi:hypothetical protein OU994_25360 [Pseudoduganella sp. SL102]|uniref:COG4648 family protein n=1 Tax=Pseudoduganella sp. SL102 TaxID=2995154 RepID=UPI00248C8A05|nr:hypothetical protein [Pseudoduganella sp. SL102]WBS01567.1 hypothetical protein OU994_25360 [Pseudoduganella sp. SL102]